MLTRGTTTRKIERRVATLVVMSVVMAVAAGSSAGATGGVLKRGQTISFTSPNPSPVNVGGTYTPTATATSGLPVAISIDPISSWVCSRTGAVVTFKAAGLCIINANQAGNATYSPARRVQQWLKIVRRTQTISFTSANPSPVNVGGAYTPTAAATSGLAVAISIDAASSRVCSRAGAVVTFKAVGLCIINANQAGNATYNPASRVQQSVNVVLKRGQTISFTSANPSPVNVGGTYSPTATATSGLAVAISIDAASAGVCSLSGAVVSFDAAGTCTINANQAGNAGYTSAPQVQQSVSVAPSAQTISFTSANPSPVNVGGTYTPTASATSGLSVVLTIDAASAGVCSLSGAVVSFDAAGTCTINANQAGNAAYDPAPQVQQSLSVARSAQTISFTSVNPSPLNVGGTYTPTATATSGLAVAISIDAGSAAVCSLSGAVVSFDAAGTCTINADQAGDTAYDAAPQVQQSITVNAPVNSSQGSCVSQGGTFEANSLPWSCKDLPSAAGNDWSPLQNWCRADGGVAFVTWPTPSGGWNTSCYASAIAAFLLAASGAVNGALVISLGP
jgi:hypothetical protein